MYFHARYCFMTILEEASVLIGCFGDLPTKLACGGEIMLPNNLWERRKAEFLLLFLSYLLLPTSQILPMSITCPKSVEFYGYIELQIPSSMTRNSNQV